MKEPIRNEKISTDLKTSDFYYDLPEERIAQHPVEPRDASRLMVLDRKSNTVEHKHFHNVLDYLSEDVYKASHPTWFYTKKDSAGTQRTQICPTAGGTSAEFNAMVDAIAANMLARINQEVEFATVENICISTTFFKFAIFVHYCF